MKKIVTLGEVMMRLSTPGFSRFTQAETFDVRYIDDIDARCAVTTTTD